MSIQHDALQKLYRLVDNTDNVMERWDIFRTVIKPKIIELLLVYPSLIELSSTCDDLLHNARCDCADHTNLY